MAMKPGEPKSDFTHAGLTAWGKALVKTGTEHLDLAMVRQGKQTLGEAGAKLPSVTPQS